MKFDSQIVRYKDLEAQGYGCRQTILQRVKQGLFPAPIQLGGRQIGWKADVIKEWLDSRPTVEIPHSSEKPG